MKIVAKLAEKGVTLYCVGCEPSLSPYKEFFSAMAFRTGGQYVPLRNASLLAKVIVGGAVEEISLEKLMADVKLEVDEKQRSGVTDEKELAEAVQGRLREKGVMTNQIFMNDSNLEKATDEAIKYSKMTTMADLRKEYKRGEIYDQISGYDRSVSYSVDSLASDNTTSKMRPVVDSYKIASSEINYAQSERLVQKALSRYETKSAKPLPKE
jgi:hypothetical protein